MVLLQLGCCKTRLDASGSLELGPQVLQTRSVASLMQFFCRSVKLATRRHPIRCLSELCFVYG